MYFWLPDTSTFLEDLILQEFENIPHYIERLNNKKSLEFILNLLP